MKDPLLLFGGSKGTRTKGSSAGYFKKLAPLTKLHAVYRWYGKDGSHEVEVRGFEPHTRAFTREKIA